MGWGVRTICSPSIHLHLPEERRLLIVTWKRFLWVIERTIHTDNYIMPNLSNFFLKFRIQIAVKAPVLLSGARYQSFGSDVASLFKFLIVLSPLKRHHEQVRAAPGSQEVHGQEA